MSKKNNGRTKTGPTKRQLVLKIALRAAAAAGLFQTFASPPFNRYEEHNSSSCSPTSIAEFENEAIPRLYFPVNERTSWAKKVSVSPTKLESHIDLGTTACIPESFWERITGRVIVATFTLELGDHMDLDPKRFEATRDTSAFHASPLMKTQANSLDDNLFSDYLVHNYYGDPNICLDIIFINGCFIYKDHSKLQTKPTRRGRAHGRPPEPDVPELCIPDHHDTSATSSRVFKGSEPDTTNVDTDRIPFLPSICSSPVFELGSLKPAIATDPAELLCLAPFPPSPPFKPPRDGNHDPRVPDA